MTAKRRRPRAVPRRMGLPAAVAAALCGLGGGLGGALGIARGAGAESLPAGTVLAELPPALVQIDPAALKREREDDAVVLRVLKEKNSGEGPALFAPEGTAEAALREVLLAALQRNISIRRSGLTRDIAERALSEARAVFDPTIVAALNTTESATFSRVEHANRWKPQTEFVPVNAFDKRGRFYCMPQSAALTKFYQADDLLLSPDGGCYIIPFQTTRSPVQTNQYDRFRPAGDDPSTIQASDPDDFQPRRQRTSYGQVTLLQRLPWGVQTSAQIKLNHKQTYFKLNEVSALPPSWGEYDRPWTTSITLSASIPLPGSKNFGPTAAADHAVTTRRVAVEAADHEARAIVNSVLQSVEITFWTEVGAILNLNAAAEAMDRITGLAENVRKLHEEGYVTTSSLGQLEAQLAAIETVRDREFGNVLTASESLREALDDGQDRVLLPVGWRKLLETPAIDPGFDIDRVLDNPGYRRAAVSVRLAELALKQRQAQTRPDVSLTVTTSLSQSGSVYGYASATGSLKESLNPDIVSHTVTLATQRPWGNRAALAAVTEADSVVRQQRLAMQRVGLQLEEEYELARISLSSARHRAELARNGLRLAEAAYDTSTRLLDAGIVATYETLGRLQGLVSARIAVNAALIDTRISEVRLLGALGLLAERAGERTATTLADRQRLAALRGTGELRHFTGGRE